MTHKKEKKIEKIENRMFWMQGTTEDVLQAVIIDMSHAINGDMENVVIKLEDVLMLFKKTE